MTSQTRHQIIKIHILPDILRSKGNQTMKLGQLIEYNMRDIFLKKSYTKFSGEACPRPFYHLPLFYKSFFKNKKRSGTSFPTSFFFHDF